MRGSNNVMVKIQTYKLTRGPYHLTNYMISIPVKARRFKEKV